MEPLREMFRHHAWATLTLLDYCERLPPEKLREAAPGTYGPILETFIHLVAADQRYLERLTGQPAAARLREGDTLALTDLRPRFEASVQLWEGLLDRVDELDVTLQGRGGEPDVPHAQNLLILQAIHHGNDHRTHICSVLTVLGLEPPDIDGWSYWDATHTSKT
jgi:uncharacterized damage-inducible protein DinB